MEAKKPWAMAKTIAQGELTIVKCFSAGGSPHFRESLAGTRVPF